MSSDLGLNLRLTDSAKAVVAAALDAPMDLGGTLPDQDTRPYLEQGAKLLRNTLPAEVLEALAAWRHDATAWLTLRNLPAADDRIGTPLDGFCDESLLTTPNLLQFGMLHLLGLTPVSYRWENDGLLIRNVAPRADAARTNTSWGYANRLDWHTDDSVLEHLPGSAPGETLPHYLSFYGMRNTEGVPTELLAVDTVLAALPAEVAEALRRPEFAISAPESYADENGLPLTRTGAPMLWQLPSGHQALRYGPERITGETPEASAALAAFEALLEELPGTPVLAGAGDFHIFDNRRVMHRRIPFEPAQPGRARWLRRCYALSR